VTNLRAISYFLVRYGQLGRIGWFGSIHHPNLPRGTNVVVHSATGRWPGVVLAQSLAIARPESGLAGELESIVAAAPATHTVDATKLVMHARAWLESQVQPQGSSAAAPIFVLDGEIALDGDVGVIVFLGEPSSRLGIAAAELARQLGLARIQWLSQQSIASETIADWPQVSTHSHAMATNTHENDLKNLHELASMLAEADSHEPSTIVKASRILRRELGLSGTYLQKLRGLLSPAQSDISRQWMVRVKTTAGRLSPSQLMALMEVARQHGNGTLRVTARQGLQLHGISSPALPTVQQALRSLLLTPRGSCGDVLRNVTCCPFPANDPIEQKAQSLAAMIGNRWLPLAPWLEWFFEPEQRVEESFSTSPGVALQDPAYPHGYLPHKWKIGVATSGHDCCDVLINDLAFIVKQDEERGIVVDTFVGGGLASHPEPQLASPLGTIPYDKVDNLIQAIMDWHREQTVERERRTRRLRHFVNAIGLTAFREQISNRLASPADLRPFENDGPAKQPSLKTGRDGNQYPTLHRHGRWSLQPDSTWSLQCQLSGGRIPCSSVEEVAWWQGLLDFTKRINIGPRLTLVVHGIAMADKERVEQHLQNGIKSIVAPDENIRMLPCVAFPTCPFAVAEAERAQDVWRDAVQKQLPILARLGYSEARSHRPQTQQSNRTNQVEVAISGCTNGCSRPWLTQLGIIAEASNRYRVLIGGTPNQLAHHVGTISRPEEIGELLIKWEQASQVSAQHSQRVENDAPVIEPPRSK
jgi:sulfite reductase (ferredoxin)